MGNYPFQSQSLGLQSAEEADSRGVQEPVVLGIRYDYGPPDFQGQLFRHNSL